MHRSSPCGVRQLEQVFTGKMIFLLPINSSLKTIAIHQRKAFWMLLLVHILLVYKFPSKELAKSVVKIQMPTLSQSKSRRKRANMVKEARQLTRKCRFPWKRDRREILGDRPRRQVTTTLCRNLHRHAVLNNAHHCSD